MSALIQDFVVLLAVVLAIFGLYTLVGVVAFGYNDLDQSAETQRLHQIELDADFRIDHIRDQAIGDMFDAARHAHFDGRLGNDQ